MTPGLLVWSRDADFVNQLRAQFSAQFDLVVADKLESVRSQSQTPGLRAFLAHVSPKTINGHSAGTLQTELERIAATAPVFGLIDPKCPEDVRDAVARRSKQHLVLPLDFDRLRHLLDHADPLLADPSGCCVGLPHRTLYGQTRSLVTFTPSMFDIFDELKVAAAHDVIVLLIGETGSGKTHLARLIHELSPRHQERCLTVACGALPPDLIESELFGYVKGAFTGADCDKLGKFAAASRGTLLLDEIDVLAPEQQAKLLRVIETGEYEPVGSNDTQTSSARLIVASNIDLEQLVKAGKFRMDLYYRLNTLSFRLPPLRERPWDIEYLARKFALEHGRTHNIELKHIEPEFVAALRQYAWPGNIRELENVIRRAVLYCSSGVLTLGDLPSTMRPAKNHGSPACVGHGNGNGKQNGNGNGHGSGCHLPRPMTLEQRVDEIERRIIEESLHRHNYHRSETARELGISRVTLYNKMKKFGMLN